MTPHLDPASILSTWHSALVLAPALAAMGAAVCAGLVEGSAAAWRVARAATSAAAALAAVSLAAVLYGSQGAAHGLRADAVGGLVMLLVASVGWVIVRYSQAYLNGEAGECAYVRWLMVTLATVFAVVVTNHVLVLALAWTATSLALHRLLTFFGDRPQAVVAAHKKFIVGRAADLCMLVATALLHHAFGTFDLDRIALQAGTEAPLPPSAQAAVLLIACAAVLKCAQLPFHGWLIQVMEAPTPVSALLHAGVVNLGGFVLMRFAPLIADVAAAQVLLVVAGTTTAVGAALVMTTRIGIKVMLAWSTCAQMGFMLMQCGLGAWEMALLHLVAHSLYKAHAFLGAGGAVRRAMLMELAPRAPRPGPMALAIAASIGLCMTWTAAAAWGAMVPAQTAPPTLWVLAGIVSLACVPLVHARSWRQGGGWSLAGAAGAFGAAFVYFGLHALLGHGVPTNASAPPAALLIAVALSFAGLFLMQSLLTVAPHGAWARRLYPWFFGGLFLDEKFSRFAFALWPPPASAPNAPSWPLVRAASPSIAIASNRVPHECPR